MRLTLSSALLAIVGALSACGTRERATDAPQGPAASSLGDANAVAVAPCHDGDVRCRDEATLERCEAGVLRAVACGNQSLCVAEGCLPPDSLGSSAAARSLLAPVADAWVNAWTVRGPLTERELEGLDPTRGIPFEPTATPLEKTCNPEGFVTDARWSTSRAGNRHHVLTGLMFVGRTQPAVLRLQTRGRVRIWLRGSLVLERDTKVGDPAYIDEDLVPVELVAGANPIAVAVTPTGAESPGFRLRLGREDGSLLEHRWSLTHGQTCGVAELTRTELENRLGLGELAPSVRFRLEGLAPHEAVLEGSASASLGAGAAKQRDERHVGAFRFPSAELSRGASLELHVPFERAGTQTLTLSLHRETDALERSFPLTHRGTDTERLAKLAREYLHGSSADRRPATLPEGLNDDARASFEHDLRTVLAAAEAGHQDVRWLRDRTDWLERSAAAIVRGEDPYASEVGVVHRAYRSPLDERLQPYVLYVPPSYRRAKKPLPLVVVSHGLNHDPALALRIVFGEGPKEDEDRGYATRHLPKLMDYGAFVLAPGGYRDAGQRTVGEADVLDAIAHVRAAYPIDERLVALTGYSLGGTVSFTVPLHYPSLFSASAPLCGYPNLLNYREVSQSPHLPFEEVMLGRRYIRNYAENGLHLPLHIVHGSRDNPERSAVVAERYRELGYPRVFQIEKDVGHNVWDEAYEEGKLLGWLKLRKRPERPEHVRLKTGELRYDRAYWLRLTARKSEEQLASIDATYRPNERAFDITTEGVEAFALDLTGFDANLLRIDGQALPLEAGSGERHFVRENGRFSKASNAPDHTGKKRSGVAGPLDDVLRHRSLIVYGTGVAAEIEANRLVAEHWSSHDSWAGAHFPVVQDRDVSEADLRGRSLVLIGRPETNSLTARVAASLPVAFEHGALTFRGVRHEGRSVGVSLIHPSPFDSNEYVVLHAGVGYEGTLSSRHLPRLSPDYVIYDAGLRAARGGEVLGARNVRDAGFFSADWH